MSIVGNVEPQWEVFAIRYAHHNRSARENFLGPLPADIHDGPMPLDYFVWAIKSDARVFVLDTGFDEAMARKRGRDFLHCPGEGLRAIGIEASRVQDVIVSHMHYDHCGNHALFPNACYHVQDREMLFSTGRSMCNAHMRIPFEEEDVVAMVRKLFAGRLIFHDGDEDLAPGLSLHYVGGHSMGLQMLRVNTRRGWVVLAADAAHLYENLEHGVPYPILYNAAEVVEGYRRAYALASSPDHVIPGHDPLVLERYPAASPELKGWVARLD
jgi:glyoxylase-like metal-dependent hydrolase (beta-lactamase superfamily II)